MSWVVVLVLAEGLHTSARAVETFGPYATPEEAESARRRVHFDRCYDYFSGHRAFVAPIGGRK